MYLAIRDQASLHKPQYRDRPSQIIVDLIMHVQQNPQLYPEF